MRKPLGRSRPLLLSVLILVPAVLVVLSAAERPVESQGRQIAVPRIGAPKIPEPVVDAPAIQAPGVRRAVQSATPVTVLTARTEGFVEAARRGLNYLPGEVIVKFKPGLAPGQQERALAGLRSRPEVDGLEWRRGGVAVVRDDRQPNAHILAGQLSAQPDVEWAEPNYIARVEPVADERETTTPSPMAPVRALPSWLRPTGVPNDADYSTYQWNFNLLSMPAAWDIQPGGKNSIIVAVIDTGITLAAETRSFPLWTGSSFQNVSMAFAVNPDLPASRLVTPRDFAFLDPAGPVLDMDGHGTHVSGTIGEATNNGTLVAGMAYNVRVMPVKVCVGYWEVMIGRAQLGVGGFAPSDAGGCAYQDIADGIRYAADNGARVMNISIGGTGTSQTIRDALTYAVSRGAFVSISMGNSYEKGNPIIYPAKYAESIDGVMSVASLNKNSGRSYYSSTGSHCEIGAPGGDSRAGVGTTDRGLIWQSTLLPGDSSTSLTVPRFDRYDKIAYQGTSMAAPHVAGLAALLMSQAPGISPANVEQIIKQTAKDLGAAGRDDEFGYGLIQPRAALFGSGIRK